MSRDAKKKKENEDFARRAYYGLAIPALMASGPVVGYLLARAAIAWFGASPRWAYPVLVLFGVAAGFWQAFEVVKRIRDLDKPAK